MGGVMVFDYQKQRITLLHNRDNWDARTIDAADWSVWGILGGWCKTEKNGGVWLGVTKEGRFACLVDSSLHDDDDYRRLTHKEDLLGPSLLPFTYLMRKDDTPEMFADWLRRGMPDETCTPEPDPRDLTYTYELIVGDLYTSTMLQISKPVASSRVFRTRSVPYGIHTLSLSGLDSRTSLKDIRLRTLFEEHIGSYENGETSLEELTQKVLGDRVETVPGDKMSSIFVEKKDYHGMERNGMAFSKKRSGMEQRARRPSTSNEF